jgi:Zn-dependent protease with chaperone function
MEILVIILLALAGFGLFFFIIKRLLRMAIRVALFGALLFALLLGALAWWWYDPLSSRTQPNANRRDATTRPARAR